MTTNLELVAVQLDVERKARLVKSQDIDVEKYLKNNDVGHKVRIVSDWLDEITENYINPPINDNAKMPWTKTQDDFNFRLGEVTLYAGGNGGGKSLITGQIALHLIKQKRKCVIASFEMKPTSTIHRMLRQFAGEFIDDPLTNDREKYIKGLTQRFNQFAGEHLYIYDQQGSTTPNQTIAMARYCAVELGIEHIFIDSLMKVCNAEDNFNEQKYFVDELTALARDHNVHIHLIHHIRKLQSEEVQPGKYDIKGTGAITDQVDNVFLMWRNKQKENRKRNGEKYEEDLPDAYLMCEKQRNGEAQEMYGLYYHQSSQQFIETWGGATMDFDNKGKFRG
jgi:twinkle protein